MLRGEPHAGLTDFLGTEHRPQFQIVGSFFHSRCMVEKFTPPSLMTRR
jgi:hypothetical protein